MSGAESSPAISAARSLVVCPLLARACRLSLSITLHDLPCICSAAWLSWDASSNSLSAGGGGMTHTGCSLCSARLRRQQRQLVLATAPHLQAELDSTLLLADAVKVAVLQQLARAGALCAGRQAGGDDGGQPLGCHALQALGPDSLQAGVCREHLVRRGRPSGRLLVDSWQAQQSLHSPGAWATAAAVWHAAVVHHGDFTVDLGGVAAL